MKIDNTRTFLVSSPTNGIESDKEGYISKNPFSPLYGDGKCFRKPLLLEWLLNLLMRSEKRRLSLTKA